MIRLASEEKGDFSFLDSLDKGQLSHYLDVILQTTTYFKKQTNLLTLGVDNDKAGRDFIDKLREQGYPFEQNLPHLDVFSNKTDWNEELIRRKTEPSPYD